MALTYQDEVVTRTVVEKQVRVPEEWGMYSKAGNKRMKKLAEELVAAAEKAEYGLQRLKAFSDYYAKWVKVSNTKTYGEAGDTDVREGVWGFSVEVGKAIGIERNVLGTLWDAA